MSHPQIDRLIADARAECVVEGIGHDWETVARRLAAKLYLMTAGASPGFMRAGLDRGQIGKKTAEEPPAL